MLPTIEVVVASGRRGTDARERAHGRGRMGEGAWKRAHGSPASSRPTCHSSARTPTRRRSLATIRRQVGGTRQGRAGTRQGQAGTLQGRAGTLQGRAGTLQGRAGNRQGLVLALGHRMHLELPGGSQTAAARMQVLLLVHRMGLLLAVCVQGAKRGRRGLAVLVSCSTTATTPTSTNSAHYGCQRRTVCRTTQIHCGARCWCTLVKTETTMLMVRDGNGMLGGACFACGRGTTERSSTTSHGHTNTGQLIGLETGLVRETKSIRALACMLRLNQRHACATPTTPHTSMMFHNFSWGGCGGEKERVGTYRGLRPGIDLERATGWHVCGRVGAIERSVILAVVVSGGVPEEIDTGATQTNETETANHRTCDCTARTGTVVVVGGVVACMG